MSARPEFIARDVDVVPAASLIAEPTRAAMITALLDDRPLAAGELARLAGVSPATASAHLARLLTDGGQPSNGGLSGAGAPAGNGATAGAGPGYPGRRQGAAPQAQIRPEAFVVTPDGAATLTSFGLNIGALERGRRRFAGACLDWTERKPHLNGALGAAMTARLLGLGWIERGSRRRAVRVTPAGCEGLASTFGWSLGD